MKRVKGAIPTIEDDLSKLPNHYDHVAERHEFLFKMPVWMTNKVAPYLEDQRDIPMLHFMFNILVTTVPMALLIFFGPPIVSNWMVGIVYMVTNYVLYLGRYLLTLHYSQHLRLFSLKKAGWWPGTLANLILPYFVSPLFGVPSGMYYMHHVVMHHAENNVFPWDVSSTMPYQRNYFPHFLLYWIRYFAAIWVQLPYYAFKRHRYDLFARCVINMALFWVILTSAYKYNPVGALFTLILPFCFSSFLMMFGNFSQHIFVDPKEPNNSYRSAYITMNNFGNQVSYNDGYHILHHLNSRTHWSDFPSRFNKDYEKFYTNKSIVFEGIDVMYVGFHVFTGQLEKLAKSIHHFEGKPKMTTEEIIALFKERFEAVDCNTLTKNQLEAHADQED